MLHPPEFLESLYDRDDPWGYDTCADDARRLEQLLEHLGGRRFRRALDVGCGTGFLTQHLPAGEIVGTDVSAGALAQARKRLDPAVSLVQSSVFELTMKVSGTFDLIVCTGVLYPSFIGPAHQAVVLQMNALLEPGGVLVSVHIDEKYHGSFPYSSALPVFYHYRDWLHRLEVYTR